MGWSHGTYGGVEKWRWDVSGFELTGRQFVRYKKDNKIQILR